MAVPTNTFTNFDAIGNREDLIDSIFNIAPFDTPFLTMSGNVRATNQLHEWQTDTLASAGDNKVIVGDDVDADAVVPTVRLNNRTQLSDKAVSIASTQEAHDKAGRNKEMAYQLALRARELKTDMENALVGLNNAKVTGNNSTAAELASVQSWIATNDDFGAGGSSPTGDGTDARGDGTQRALTEDLILSVQQNIFSNSNANANMLICSPFHKRIISTTFTGNGTRFQTVADNRLNTNIEVWEAPFGPLKITPNRFLRARDLLILDMVFWKIAFLQSFQQKPLAKTGHADRRMLFTEYTLESRNEAANGSVNDLTTS